MSGYRPAHPGDRARAVRSLLLAPFDRRSGARVAYCLLSSVPAVAGFVVVIAVAVLLGSALTLTVLGAVPGVGLLVAGLTLARALGRLHRALARRFLGVQVVDPARVAQPHPGLVAGVVARLRDPAAWRAVAYVLVKMPLAVLGLWAVTWWLVGVVDLVAPVRRLVGQRDVDLVWPVPGGGPRLDSFGESLGAAAVGLVVLLAAPWLARAVTALDGRLVRALLGAGALEERVRDLEETRAIAVDEAADRLRRLERDLHDGAQVRLAALAMNLDMVREQLDARDRPELHRLVETARDNAVGTLAELRDLSRGLHPPVLDAGLADALATLAATSALPVELSVDLTGRPTRAIEALAYYGAAELLANVHKHSGARACRVDLRTSATALDLRVTDDGHGGAHAVRGGGIAGLVDRVRTVDGDLTVRSPGGGPTTVDIRLPLHA
ncbi:sensor domain-containing protein [Cellulomonas sp. ACRRI]|uniref:sensor histidine kinase n=1 Tax=Cellulomonas sp. ACRRI TaxID=2918188 RepID=UPI001EF24279|nr:sensor histidine kinase [Cellulomonas sp. ACRRI]MCG7285114.1 sensor domain-containing protein [Cellulomonas sp. ACRRI]